MFRRLEVQAQAEETAAMIGLERREGERKAMIGRPYPEKEWKNNRASNEERGEESEMRNLLNVDYGTLFSLSHPLRLFHDPPLAPQATCGAMVF